MPYLGRTPSAVPVTADDIPANSIDASKIIDGSIELAEISDGAITSTKLATAVNADIATGVAKVSITSAQASDITTNNAKVTNYNQTKSDIEGLGIDITSSQLPAGSVVQVQSINLTTNLTLATSTWTDITGSITFTPKFANSKLMIMFRTHVYTPTRASGAWEAANFRVLRNAVVVSGADSTSGYGTGMVNTDTVDRFMVMYSKDYFDSPASTAAIVYKPQSMSRNGTAMYHNVYGSGSLTIMEISG